MLANVAWRDPCRECHSVEQGSIARNLPRQLAGINIRRVPRGDHGRGRSRNTVTAAGGNKNILPFSAIPENDQVEVNPNGCALGARIRTMT
jgi:hypothetical protein